MNMYLELRRAAGVSNPTHYNKITPKRNGKRGDTSLPARTRPGATYPGGKHLRKARAKLSARQKEYEASLTSALRRNPTLGPGFFTKPGKL